MSFPSIIVHFMITYTLYTTCTGYQRGHCMKLLHPYLDFLFYATECVLSTKLYDKLHEFEFCIVKIPYICSNIPQLPAYGVYI